jgi:hypothetical protein
VQNPKRVAPFLAAVHGGKPAVLREDFCGTGAVCRAWVTGGSMGGPPVPGGRKAIAVDQDAEPLSRLRGTPGVKIVRANVLDCPLRADVISATNFPIGYWHTRDELITYLRLCRERLRPKGIFVCDTYGGATAFTRGTLTRDIWTEDGIRIHYTWEQREADPLTGMVIDCLHFRAHAPGGPPSGGEVLYQEADAFVYHWRLWSVPELREAMAEVGFRASEVYSELADAEDSDGQVYVRSVDDPRELDDSFVVLVAARI